jgi:hypothetical protein
VTFVVFIIIVVVPLNVVRPQKEILWITLPDIFILLLQFPFKVQADPRIRGFSIRGFSYPRFTATRKKTWKIKEINGSQVSKRAPSENGP